VNDCFVYYCKQDFHTSLVYRKQNIPTSPLALWNNSISRTFPNTSHSLMRLILAQSHGYQTGCQVPTWLSVSELDPVPKVKVYLPPFSRDRARKMWWIFTISTIIRGALRYSGYEASIYLATHRFTNLQIFAVQRLPSRSAFPFRLDY
jgi:hypothetical protein